MNLPNEITFKIFLEIKNVSRLKQLNKKFEFLVTEYIDYYYGIFDKISPNWKVDLKPLIKKLIKNKKNNEILFLRNNYHLTENDERYINFYAGYYNNPDLINNYRVASNGAALGGHLELLKNIGIVNMNKNEAEEQAKISGNEDIINWLNEENSHMIKIIEDYKSHPDSYNCDIIYFIIKNRDLNALKWIWNENNPINYYFTINSIFYDAFCTLNFDIMMWALKNGAYKNIPGDKNFKNIVDLLNWLIKNKIKSASLVIEKIGSNGRIDLAYDFSGSRKKLRKLTSYAARYGHLELVKWAIEKGFDDYGFILINAAAGARINVINYLYDLGYRNSNFLAKGAAK